MRRIVKLRVRLPRMFVVAALAGLTLVAPAAQAQVDLLGLREQLEIERDSIRQSMSSWIRAEDEKAFRDGKPQEAFRVYLDAALRALDAESEYPELKQKFARFDGNFDVENDVHRDALGIFLGDYIVVRYGQDLVRELRTLVGFETYDNVWERNSENLEFREAVDSLADLATRLGLQVENHAYETLEITLAPAGGGVQTAPLAMFTHLEVMKPVAYKWDQETQPFNLTLHNGRWVGLGTYSDKGPTILNLFALRALRDAGIPLARPVVLLVGTTTSAPDSGIHTSLEKMTTKPSMVLAADGTFPYSRGQMGRLLARVSSARGMKSIAGIQPETFYIYKLTAFWSMNAIPAETRAWVMFEEPENSLNPSLDIVNKWRGITEGYQATVPVTRYGTYVQDDTLHFFSYTLPSHVESPEGRNAISDMAGCLVNAPMYPNSAWDVIRFIEHGFQQDPSGEAAGLRVDHPEMGTSTLHPVQFDRIGDEVSVLVAIHWPVGRDRAWIRDRMQKLVARFNQEYEAEMTLSWEGEGREPVLHEVEPQVGELLIEAYEVATGDFGAEPAGASRSAGALLPHAIPFGPERPNVAKRGFTRHESISEREISDLAVAYASVLAWFGVRPALP